MEFNEFSEHSGRDVVSGWLLAIATLVTLFAIA
jgi:hypothetical protein